MGETITISELDGPGSFSAYLARPAGEARAAIVVVQEIFGVNQGIRTKCDAWAERGYLAVAPDLFWRQSPGFAVDPDAPGALEQGIALMQAHDQNRGIADIEATVRAARAMTGGGKVGLVGFCLGGRVAYMAAARTDVDASVGYYAVGLNELLGEAHAIARPLMLHIPTADHFVPPPVQAEMHAVLDPHPKATLHDYPGLDHGFADTAGKRRDEAGATLAEKRTVAFFADALA